MKRCDGPTNALFINNFNYYKMQESEEEGEEKGLFTFYKEQQMQEDLLRINFKKKGKNKNRKSKRRIKSQMKASESKVFVINEDN